MILAVNLKFTGLVYAIVLVCVAFIFAERRGWRMRDNAPLIAGALAVLSIVSISPYAHNLLRHHSIVYPLNTVDVIKLGAEMPASFRERNRFEKFLIASFAIPDSLPGSSWVPRMQLVVPKLWHYQALAEVPDMRLQGFGSIFVWSLLLSGMTLATGVVAAWKTDALRAAAPIAIVGVWVVTSAALNREFWWARFASQLWLLPILVGAFLARVGRSRLAAATIAPPLVGSLLTIFFWVPLVLKQHRETVERMAAIDRAGHVAMLNGWKGNHGVFTLAEYARQRGLDAELVQGGALCDVSLGIVKLCRDESAERAPQ
jgi:hypothetical protein